MLGGYVRIGALQKVLWLIEAFTNTDMVVEILRYPKALPSGALRCYFFVFWDDVDPIFQVLRS